MFIHCLDLSLQISNGSSHPTQYTMEVERLLRGVGLYCANSMWRALQGSSAKKSHAARIGCLEEEVAVQAGTAGHSCGAVAVEEEADCASSLAPAVAAICEGQNQAGSAASPQGRAHHFDVVQTSTWIDTYQQSGTALHVLRAASARMPATAIRHLLNGIACLANVIERAAYVTKRIVTVIKRAVDAIKRYCRSMQYSTGCEAATCGRCWKPGTALHMLRAGPTCTSRACCSTCTSEGCCKLGTWPPQRGLVRRQLCLLAGGSACHSSTGKPTSCKLPPSSISTGRAFDRRHC